MLKVSMREKISERTAFVELFVLLRPEAIVKPLRLFRAKLVSRSLSFSKRVGICKVVLDHGSTSSALTDDQILSPNHGPRGDALSAVRTKVK